MGDGMYANSLLMNTLNVVVGLNIKEVAHDIQKQVAKYVVDCGLVNSFDTWHGIQCNYTISFVGFM